MTLFEQGTIAILAISFVLSVTFLLLVMVRRVRKVKLDFTNKTMCLTFTNRKNS